MKRAGWLGWLMLAATVHAAEPQRPVVASGKPDREIPGWTVHTVLPAGWTQDCCTYASAIGVNLVLYQGDWTGEPDRVFVLNVWPAKLASLDAELQADRKHYLDIDPAGKVNTFALANASMPCKGVLYRGSDHKDDAVVFCDPGKTAGNRLSWSVALDSKDATRDQVLALFRQVAEQSRYTATPAHP